MSLSQDDQILLEKEMHFVYPSLIVNLSCSILGIFGHVNIIVATYRDRNLHTTCGYLIVIAAICDILQQSSNFPYAYFVLSGNLFIPLDDCIPLQMLPAIGMMYGLAVMLSIGIDRLCAIMFPLRYRTLNTFYYLLIHQIFPITFTSFILWNNFQEYLRESQQSLTVCMLTHFFFDRPFFLWGTTACGTALMTLLMYGIAWIVVRKKSEEDISVRRALSALSIIALVFCGGWCLTILTIPITDFIGIDDRVTRFLIQTNSAVFVNFGCAVNYFVYFRCSSIYKQNFLDQLGPVQTLFYKRNSVQPRPIQVE